MTVPPEPVPAEGPPTPPEPSEGEVRAAGVLVGKVVEAEVTSVGPRETEVRLLDGRTGVVASEELPGAAVGARVEGALLAREDPRGRVWLSVTWAAKQRAWNRVETALAESESLSGPVVRSTKGGFVVDLGLRAFLPMSLIGSARADALVGTEVDVVVTEANRDTDRVVVSIRDHERRQRRTREKELLRSLAPGDRVRGRVVSTAEYGAVLDLGGARGLIHRSELTWGRLGAVEDHVTPGQELDAVVLDVNVSKRRVGLSLRQLTDDPLKGLEPGSVGSATVVRVVDYGAFARLDDSGVEGLVHISELSDVPGFRPEQLVAPGEQVMVKVLDIDRRRRRVSLSVRRVLVDD